MEKYTMEEIRKGQGCFTGGSITMIGEITTIDDPRRFITYSVSDRTGNDVELIGAASLNKSGGVNLTLI